MLNFKNSLIPNIWSFLKLVDHSNLENYPIIQILNFCEWGLKLQRSKMRIGEITNSAEYQMDEQNQNLPIFGIKLWFSELKKKTQILKFRKSSIFHYWQKNNQSSQIVEFQKLANFFNLTICKTQNSKNFEFDGELSNMYFECSNNLNNHKNKELIR